jgi:hypothetical protein
MNCSNKRTRRIYPACHSIRFPADANVAQAFGHDAAGMDEISHLADEPRCIPVSD